MVPADLRSAVYAARIERDGAVDHIPFFVRPPTGKPTARLAVLIPSFTYIIYGNMARGPKTAAVLQWINLLTLTSSHA